LQKKRQPNASQRQPTPANVNLHVDSSVRIIYNNQLTSSRPPRRPPPLGPIGRLSSVPAEPGLPLAILAPLQSTRTTHHSRVCVRERLDPTNSSPAVSVKALSRPRRRHMCQLASQVSFFEQPSLATLHLSLRPSFVQGHVYRGGIAREYASCPSVPRGRKSKSLAASPKPKRIRPGLDCHFVFCRLSVAVFSACASRRPVAGAQKAPACRLTCRCPLLCTAVPEHLRPSGRLRQSTLRL